MAEITGIAWTDSTFNPWIGCTKVGPGCDHCYAEALDKRHRWGGSEHWGVGTPRMRTSAANWHHPIAWNAKPFYECLSCRNRFCPKANKEGYITCPRCSHASGKMVDDPAEASAVKRVRRRVFCASLADWLDNEAPDAWRNDLIDLIKVTPALDWLLLTKRIGRVKHWTHALMPNVWLGATIVNQEEADRDVPKLLEAPAAKRFVSYEPALGPVDWTKYPGIDWIIVGGESTQGARARDFDVTWAIDTIYMARQIGAAPFVKQIGSGHHTKDRAGADPAEWPGVLRVQEFPA